MDVCKSHSMKAHIKCIQLAKSFVLFCYFRCAGNRDRACEFLILRQTERWREKNVPGIRLYLLFCSLALSLHILWRQTMDGADLLNHIKSSCDSENTRFFKTNRTTNNRFFFSSSLSRWRVEKRVYPMRKDDSIRFVLLFSLSLNVLVYFVFVFRRVFCPFGLAQIACECERACDISWVYLSNSNVAAFFASRHHHLFNPRWFHFTRFHSVSLPPNQHLSASLSMLFIIVMYAKHRFVMIKNKFLYKLLKIIHRFHRRTYACIGCACV